MTNDELLGAAVQAHGNMEVLLAELAQQLETGRALDRGLCGALATQGRRLNCAATELEYRARGGRRPKTD